MKWSTGRITAFHPGSDGIVRVATLRTGSGEIKRAANRLCVLPIEGSINVVYLFESSASKAGNVLMITVSFSLTY